MFSQSVSFPDVRILEYGGSGSVGPVRCGGVGVGYARRRRQQRDRDHRRGERDLGRGGDDADVFKAAGANYTTRVITNPDGDIAEDRAVNAAGTYSATATHGDRRPVGHAARRVPGPAAGADHDHHARRPRPPPPHDDLVDHDHDDDGRRDPRATTGQWTAPVNYGGRRGSCSTSVLIPGTSKILFFEDGAGTYVLDPNTGPFAHADRGQQPVLRGPDDPRRRPDHDPGGDLNGQPADGTVNTNVYNPATNTWTSTAAMHYLRWYPTATKLPDGRILATSGTASSVMQQIPEIYDPATNTWTALPSATTSIPSYPFMFVLPDGRVVAGRGRSTRRRTYRC